MIIKIFARLLLLCLLVLPTGLVAEETSAATEGDPARLEPWGILRLRSLERTRELMRNVSQQLPWRPLTGVLRRLEGLCEIPGLNLDEPVVLFVRFRDNTLERPELTLVLPMTDTNEFMRSCIAMPSLKKVESAGEGRWLIKREEMELLAVSNGGRILVTNFPPLFEQQNTVLSWLSNVDLESDIAIRLQPRGFPLEHQNAWRDVIFEELSRAKKQAIDSSTTKPSLEVSSLSFLELFLKRWEHGVHQIDFKLRYEDSLRLTMDCLADPKSKLASDLSELPLDRIRFEGIDSESVGSVAPTCEVTLAVNIPGPLKALIGLGIDRLRDELGREFGPRLKDEDLAATGGAFEAISTTLATGRLESHLAFIPVTDHRLVLYGSIAGKNAKLLRTSLKTVLPYTAQSKEIRSVQMDAVKNERLLAHQVDFRNVRPDDQLLYGPGSSLYMGTSSNAFVFAVGGNDALDVLGRLTAISEPSPPLVSIQCRLRPWVTLLEQSRNQENELLRDLLNTVSEADPQDRLDFQVSSQRDGLRFELNIESELLEMAGILARKQLENLSR